MNGKFSIEKIRLRNILSFGNQGEELDLQSLNIIIGQNASGKSNLVDVIKLLRSLSQENGLANFISRSGGIGEWVWKGLISPLALEIEIQVSSMDYMFSYNINVPYISERIGIYQETLEEINNAAPVGKENTNWIPELFPQKRNVIKKNINPDDSMFSPTFLEQDIRTRFAYTVIYSSIISPKIYTDLQTSRGSEIRRPQPLGTPDNFLEEDGSNLALILNDLQVKGKPKDKIIENLKKFNSRIQDYGVRIQDETIALLIREDGLEKPISAMRLSDGTLKFLCLLAVLCHPEPPPLVCIEEPETGLHPDILPTIAELLIEASKRTQLIVTTHSDILVSAFSDMPEAVLICEKDDDGTHFKRLEKEDLAGWLKDYQLGDLWLKGEIGGTRW